MTPETRAILFRDADRVEFKEWFQGAHSLNEHGMQAIDPDGNDAVKWDALAAIDISAIGLGVPNGCWGAYQAVAALLRKLGLYDGIHPFTRGPITAYNDAPNRTAAEVAHLLRGAALEGLWAC